jgi:hypothetical protein
MQVTDEVRPWLERLERLACETQSLALTFSEFNLQRSARKDVRRIAVREVVWPMVVALGPWRVHALADAALRMDLEGWISSREGGWMLDTTRASPDEAEPLWAGDLGRNAVTLSTRATLPDIAALSTLGMLWDPMVIANPSVHLNKGALMRASQSEQDGRLLVALSVGYATLYFLGNPSLMSAVVDLVVHRVSATPQYLKQAKRPLVPWTEEYRAIRRSRRVEAADE